LSDLDIPYGFIKGNELYLSAWGDQKDRRIGEIKEDGPQAAVEYFKKKYEDFAAKIKELTDTIEAAENKGSYLMKLLHLREQLKVHEGLGDYLALEKQLATYEAQLTMVIALNRERNTEIKTALLAEMKAAVAIINWNEATEKVQDVKTRWLKTGNAKEEVHEQLETDFWELVQGFFDRKKAFFDDKRKLAEVRKRKYEVLIREAGTLSDLHGKARFDKVKELKAAWELVGNIPAKEYKLLTYQFNNLLKGRKELPAPNFDRIQEELDKMYDRRIPIDKELLQRFRKSLGSFKPREPEMREKRHHAMQLVNLIWERDFLEGLAGKKTKGFHHMEETAKAGIMKKLLQEFIRRDKDDLAQYEENSLKFAGNDPRTSRMLERKLGQQRNKIEVKEKLLKILSEKSG
jgi:hypothetical protein